MREVEVEEMHGIFEAVIMFIKDLRLLDRCLWIFRISNKLQLARL